MSVWNDGPHGSIRTVGCWARGGLLMGMGEQHARMRDRRAPGRGRVVRAVLVASAALAFAPPAGAQAATGYKSVSAGYIHTCAVKADENIACWGDNGEGQVSGAPAGSYKSVSAGSFHTCAVKTDDSIACWGYNEFGQAPATLAGSYKSVSAGQYHTCAVKADDSIACWGGNFSGQTAAPAGSYKSVSAGLDHTCAVKADDDSIACWGYNVYGQTAAPAGSYQSVSAGLHHTCAVKADESIACWGRNQFGQVSATPAGSYESVSAGGDHTCALKSDESIACWGSNAYGQAPVAPTGSYKSVSAGYAHTCAVKPDESITCWGHNSEGQTTVPDTDAPQVTLATPADGATYARGQSVAADYACADEAGGSGLASCVGTVADGAAIDTATLGAHTFSVTATDDAGNDRTVSVGYTVSDQTDPTVTITSPVDGAQVVRHASVVADYACADEAGGSGIASCVGTVADGQPVDTSVIGSHAFSVTAHDHAGNETIRAVHYTVLDVTDPTIEITSPTEGQAIGRNTVVAAHYTCDDETGGSGVATCSGTVANGAPVDSSTLGPKTFSVTATDHAGNTDTRTVGYVVVDVTVPTITAVSPGADTEYEQGATILADYSCADEPGGSGLASCAGTVADGQPIDTSGGAHVFTINAADNAGNLASKTINYTAADRIAPQISISSPMGSYGLLRVLLNPPRAQFACADNVGGSGMASCTATADGQPVAANAIVPRGLGSHTFSVTATDQAGNTSTQTTTYTVTLL